MTEQVGGIFYDVDLDTSKLIASQRNVDAATKKVDASLTSVSKATKTLTAATELQGKVSRDLAKAQTDAAIATARFGDASNRAGLSAKAMTAATRQLPAQFTDIFTQLAAGQSPMQIFIQQGGQIKDVFGGVGPALKAVGGYLIGLLNPVTLAIAALSALGFGYFKGRQETNEFTRAIVLSGNASGVTADQLQTLAKELGNVAGITRGQAAEALTLLVRAGVQGGNALGKMAEAAILLEKNGGPAVEETAAAFAALGKDPVKAAERLNEKWNFLTADIYKQIVALEKQGKHLEAAQLAQSAFLQQAQDRIPKVTESLSWVEQGWRAVADAIKGAVDAVKNFGRPGDAQATMAGSLLALSDVQKEISLITERLNTQRYHTKALEESDRKLLASKMQQLDALNKQVGKLDDARKATEAIAAADAKRKADTDKAIGDNNKGGNKFDAVSYLIGLQERLVDAATKIDLIEREELRKNDERLKERDISQKDHEAARLLIIANAGKERAELQQKEHQAVADREERLRQKIEEIERKDAERKTKGQTLAKDAILGGDEGAKLQAELEAKTKALRDAAAIDQENATLYAEAIVALERQTWDRIREIRSKARTDEEAAQSALLTSYGGLFGSLADLTESFGSRQSGAYKVLFAVSKAFAIADSIIKIQQGIANAAALPYPANLGAMASVVAATASIVSTISSVQFGGGRQYGGPVDAGSLYRVNEAGRPEMFTASNGAQYMLPTAGGRVDNPAGGGGVSVQVQVINQHPTAEVSVTRGSDGQSVQIAVLEVANQIRENNGPVWAAMRGATNVQGRF